MTKRKSKPKAKGANGGARKGAGRPRKGKGKRDQVVKVLLTRAERAATEAVVEAENEAVNDGKPATVPTWIRDLVLDRLGLGLPSPDGR